MPASEPRVLSDWSVVRVPALAVGPGTDIDAARRAAEKPVEAAVDKLIAGCEKARGSKQFVDASWGPSDKDRDGALAFYASGKAPNANYPDPSQTVWLRPKYRSKVELLEEELKNPEEEEEEEHEDAEQPEDAAASCGRGGPKFFCEGGELFHGGVNANDVVQGRLGDCWLLSAMGVLATRADLLEGVFWGCKDKAMESNMRKYGFRVCKFFKDDAWYYVIVDDQLPVFAKNSKPVFAHCRDTSELWVPLLEKAYAKLHKSYDALIGGYIDGGLRDLTGLACQELVLREGHIGFHPKNKQDLDSGRLFDMLDEYLNEWGCMMGCSIQPDPSAAQGGVEAKVGDTGLMMRHAYGLIDVGVVKTRQGPVKLVRLRNPWGFGEWTKAWGDESKEFKENQAAIAAVFDGPVCKRKDKSNIISTSQKVEADDNDGSFFMAWDDWKKYFTVIFAGVDFPDSWAGMVVAGEWTKTSSGGNNTTKTWAANPVHRFRILQDNTRVFFSLMQDDPRLVAGKDTMAKQDPIGFHIVADTGGKPLPDHPADTIPGSNGVAQAPYKQHLSIDLEVPALAKGDYLVVPSTYYADRPGPYFMHVYADKAFSLEGGRIIAEEWGPSDVVVDFSGSRPVPKPDGAKLSKSSQFETSRKALAEQLKAKLTNFAQLQKTLQAAAKGDIEWPVWKAGLSALGLAANKAAFMTFSGGDGKLDSNELERLVAGEKEEARLFGGAGDESSPIDSLFGAGSSGDEALAGQQQQQQQNDADVLRAAVCELQSENDCLRDEMDAMREEQARMMHVLLLYGKMLKCYEGEVHPASALVKRAVRAPRKHALAAGGKPGARAAARGRSPAGAAGRRGQQPQFAGAEGGDEFMAVKPWKGAIVAPTQPKQATSLGAKQLAIEWVYGYNCERGGIKLNAAGQPVYYAAAVGVVLDTKNNSQTYFTGHTDDVICLDTFGELVATGQEGKKPFACVWSGKTGKLVARLSGFEHQRAVTHVCFSPDGSKLLTVGGDDNHSLAVYELPAGKLVGSAKGSKEDVYFATHTGKRFVTGGVKHVRFCEGEDVTKKVKPGRFGKVGGGAPQNLYCAALLDAKETLAAGGQGGQVLVFDDSSECVFSTPAEAHAGQPVEALFLDAKTKLLASGSKNGVVLWGIDGTKLTQTKTIATAAPVRAIAGAIFGLASGDVLDGDKTILSGHNKANGGEVWGLAVDGKHAISSGDDGAIKLWDTDSHRQQASVRPSAGPARCLAFSPDRKVLAVGHLDNAVSLLDAETLKEVVKSEPSKLKPAGSAKKPAGSAKNATRATCLAFSPDGSKIALGSSDCKVYVLDGKTLKSLATFTKSSATITHLDWSEDGKFLRTNDISYELLFYNVETKQQETKASALKDTEWATLSCPLTWEAQGIWPPAADGTDINSVARFGTDMIASCDDSGKVNLFPFPFPERKEAEIKTGAGHASHVTNVGFVGASQIVTTGGRDRTLIQWKIA